MMPRPLGSANRTDTKKSEPKTSNSNKRTGVDLKFNDHEQTLYDTVVKATTIVTQHDHKRLRSTADHNSGCIIVGAALGTYAVSREFDGAVADAIGGSAGAPIEGIHRSGITADEGDSGRPEVGTLDVGEAGMHHTVPTVMEELTGITSEAPMHSSSSSSSNSKVEPQQRAGATAMLSESRLDNFSIGMRGDCSVGIIGNDSSNEKAKAPENGDDQTVEITDESSLEKPTRNPETDDMGADYEVGGESADQSKGAQGGKGKGGDSGQRLSPAMSQHVRKIKSKIDANICHKKGKGIPTRKGLGYPFAGPVISPLCVNIEGRGAVDISRFHLKTVFAWIPEYLWPDIVQFVPCPNCGSAGKPDGWTPQQPRRAFLEHGTGYIIGFRYKCPTCAAHNKRVGKEEKRTTSYHAWDPQCLEKLPDDVSREFPFVSTRKSALHLRVLDRLAEDLLEGKDFANTASDVFQVYLETFEAEKKTFRTLVEGYPPRSAANDSIYAPNSSAHSQQEDPPLLPVVALKETPATGEPTYDDLFGSFHDPLKYSGAAPTETYLQHVWRMWFKDLRTQTPMNLLWTREDYQRRVLQLWNSSPPPPPSPAPAINISMLSAPIPLASLALHQLTQASSPRPGGSTRSLQMPAMQSLPHSDADAARQRHRDFLHPESPSASSSGKTSRLCGPDHHLHNISTSFQTTKGTLQNGGGFQTSGI